MEFSLYSVLRTMKSKYGDDDGTPSSFSFLSPFVATTVLKVTFFEAYCCVAFAFGFAEEWDDLLLSC
jgi:hypothetical protein